MNLSKIVENLNLEFKPELHFQVDITESGEEILGYKEVEDNPEYQRYVNICKTEINFTIHITIFDDKGMIVEKGIETATDVDQVKFFIRNIFKI